MSQRSHGGLLLAVLLLAVMSAPIVTAQPVASTDTPGKTPAIDSTVHVVNDDSDAAYTSIQAAVNDAEPDDTVRVRPGTYYEQVTLETNITVLAPEGATLDGRRFDGLSSGFRIQDGVVPVIDGFTIQNYAYGVNAERPPTFGGTDASWDAGWTARNVTIQHCSEEAIRAGNSLSDWTVENVRIEDCRAGIAAFGSSGDWTIRNAVIRDVDFHGIDGESSGEWTVRNVSITGNPATGIGTGIDVGWSSGNGTITDTTVQSFNRGVNLGRVYGNVTITTTIIQNVSHPPDDPAYSGVAIYAANTSGVWRIRDSIVRNYTRFGINATDANPPGNATRNWWGTTDPSDTACLGNVQCANALATKPEAGASRKALADTNEPGAHNTITRTMASTPVSSPEPTTDDNPRTSTPEQTWDANESSTTTDPHPDRDHGTPPTDDGSSPLIIGALVVIAAVVIGGLVGGLLISTET